MKIKVVGDGGNTNLNRILDIPPGSYVEDGEILNKIVCPPSDEQKGNVITHFFTKAGLYDGWDMEIDCTQLEAERALEEFEGKQVKW